ncbi:MAG: hypothetical protein K9W44_08955 [Candidatus Lokiarchaeota archaeon]|nr:hypothetical protein [Candidatus Harpocratesius repetitus]
MVDKEILFDSGLSYSSNLYDSGLPYYIHFYENIFLFPDELQIGLPII